MNGEKRIVIVGGGASGLFAAALLGAAQAGGRHSGQIILLERHERVGRKLLATGNGRCNLTNANPSLSRFHQVDAHPDNRTRMEGILAGFPLAATLEKWNAMGVVAMEEGDGKIYPASGQASAVLDLLRIECERNSVEIRCSAEAMELKTEGERIKVALTVGRPIYADAVLLAAGGEASPKLGGTGAGYSLLQSIGHSVAPRYAAIVPLETDTRDIRALRGCKVQASVALLEGERCHRQERGELLFTEYGLSGPPVLQLAEAWGAQMQRDSAAKMAISIDVMPDWAEEELLLAMQLRLAEQGYRQVEDFMTGWLHKQVARATARAVGIADLQRSSYSLSAMELENWAHFLKNWIIPVTGNRGMAQAQVTAGGAVLSEFDCQLQSRHMLGLFVSGELLDVHGDSGGFNLQWAWSSAAACAHGICDRLGWG